MLFYNDGLSAGPSTYLFNDDRLLDDRLLRQRGRKRSMITCFINSRTTRRQTDSLSLDDHDYSMVYNYN